MSSRRFHAIYAVVFTLWCLAATAVTRFHDQAGPLRVVWGILAVVTFGFAVFASKKAMQS